MIDDMQAIRDWIQDNLPLLPEDGKETSGGQMAPGRSGKTQQNESREPISYPPDHSYPLHGLISQNPDVRRIYEREIERGRQTEGVPSGGLNKGSCGNANANMEEETKAAILNRKKLEEAYRKEHSDRAMKKLKEDVSEAKIEEIFKFLA